MSTNDQTDPRGIRRERPSHVDALASTVISVLRDRQVVSPDGVRQFVLEHLVRAVLARKSFDVAGLFDELRGYRLTLDAIIDLYVPAAARRLGTDWVDDRINFADVTIGAMRLQSLLDQASLRMHTDLRVGQDGLHALVIVPRGEQHFLGASVVAAQLRRLGCDVGISYEEDHGALTTRVMQHVPDLVLISCGRRELLETVSNTVLTVSHALPVAPFIAVGGAFLLEDEEPREIPGVNIVTNKTVEAVALCAKSISLQSRL